MRSCLPPRITRARGQERSQRVPCTCAEKSDAHDDANKAQQHQRFIAGAQQQIDDAAGDQQKKHRFGNDIEQQAPNTQGAWCGECIRPVFQQALCGLRGGQPVNALRFRHGIEPFPAWQIIVVGRDRDACGWRLERRTITTSRSHGFMRCCRTAARLAQRASRTLFSCHVTSSAFFEHATASLNISSTRVLPNNGGI